MEVWRIAAAVRDRLAEATVAASGDVAGELWVQLSVGAVTAMVAYIAARAGATSARLVNEAARREEWWRRTQWAIDLALDAVDERKALGIKVLAELLDSELASDDDKAIGRVVLSQVLGDIPPIPGGAVQVVDDA